MSVMIRLKKVGTKKKIKHRIVVADGRSPRDGRFIEEIGFWDPSKEPPVVTLKSDRVDYWLKQGAQPTDVVRDILRKLRKS